LNPETSVLNLAILPQFVSSYESALLKSLLLASIHAIVRLVWYSTPDAFLARIPAMLKRSRVPQWVEITSGATLVLLRFKVAAGRR